MKLRMRGNSVRLRLTKSEVDQLKQQLPVQETVSFGGGAHLQYRLELSSTLKKMSASFQQSTILVRIPLAFGLDWANSTAVSLKHEQKYDAGEEPLFILIEKDFFCLKPRVHEVEDEADLFHNPNVEHGSCG